MHRVSVSKASSSVNKKLTLQSTAPKCMLFYFPMFMKKRTNEQSTVNKTNNVELTKQQTTKPYP